MTPPLDIDKLRYPNPPSLENEPGEARVFKSRQKGKFLKGPIPWSWLVQALRLPGKSIHVAIVIWFWCGIRKKPETHLNLSRLRLVGVSRFAGARGLIHLEKAGLISTIRRQGSRPLVKILDVAPDNEMEDK